MEGVPVDTLLGLGIVAILIAINAAMVAAEFAVMAVDRTRVARLAEEGSRRARIADVLVERLSFHLSGAQLGITVTSLVLGAIASPTVGAALRPLMSTVLPDGAVDRLEVPVAVALAAGVQMVLGELVPKTIAIARPLKTVLFAGASLRFIGVVAGPIVGALNGMANQIVRRLGVEPTEELASVRSLEEVELLIESSVEEGSLVSDDIVMLSRALRFRAKDAASVLVPRADVISVAATDTLSELVAVAEESGHSRFPVVGQDLDDVVGTVHVKDVLQFDAMERADRAVADIMRPAIVVVAYRELGPLLAELRSGGHLAVVVDEHGGTEGILTIEDVLEELVGEIDDEYDVAGVNAVEQSPGVWDLDGSLHRDEVAELTGFECEGEDFETLGGFVLYSLGRLPLAGEAFEADGWSVTVMSMDRLRVAGVRLVEPPDQPSEPGDEAGGAP